ncbi:hypothetical protein [Leifsonia sp. Leaf264]|uniref:hypothetical protein n=1 Tax=Leifsonia sp. Leaf264 TaxID=1736314 RepID=UPI0006F6B893|nr:hypothetical protein [Leifsonia sp. Leaf264]KQO98435.1 hypothetical protein ASF30_10260 [Leifsonia sp. Leaf264]
MTDTIARSKRRLSVPLTLPFIGAVSAAVAVLAPLTSTRGEPAWVAAFLVSTAAAGGLLVAALSSIQPEGFRNGDEDWSSQSKFGLDVLSGTIGGLAMALAVWLATGVLFTVAWQIPAGIAAFGLLMLIFGIAGIRGQYGVFLWISELLRWPY